MKIGNNYSFNFKAIQRQNNKKKSNKSKPVSYPPTTSKAASTLKAYNLLFESKRGINNAVITPDYDGMQLIYSLKSPYPKANKVKILYSVGKESVEREAFSTSKDINTGDYKVKIPVLNRINNSIYEELTINSAEYFDDTNIKIGEESPKDMVVHPETIMTIKEPRTLVIDNQPVISEFDSISEGNIAGKLTKMSYGDFVRYKGTEPIIVLMSNKDIEEMFLEIASGTFFLPMNVKGLLMSPSDFKQGSRMTDMLGHAVSRLRGRKILTLMDKSTFENIENRYYNNPEEPYVRIKMDSDTMEVSGLDKLPKEDSSPVKIPEYEFVDSVLTPDDARFNPKTVGLKAYNLGILRKSQQAGGYSVPSFYVVPSGVWDKIKKSPENAENYGDLSNDIKTIGDYHFHVQKADLLDNPADELHHLRELIITSIIIPQEIRDEIMNITEQVFKIDTIGDGKGCLIARSSFNGEDSDTIATQGLYDSFPGIRSRENLYRGIKEVGASKWSELAYMSRRNHGIPHSAIQPNIIVQQVVPVDYTFTINTADPRKNNRNKMVIQLSQGVYSCFPNSPYIFEFDKETEKIERKCFATKKRAKNIQTTVMDDSLNTQYILTDYSKDPLNLSKKHYDPVMRKVFGVAKFIETLFDGRPQDIEGGIIFNPNPETGEMEPDIYIWQSRDVHLIKR